MADPTREELDEMSALLQEYRTVSAAGADTKDVEKRIAALQKKTGIANEAPPDLFDPEEHGYDIGDTDAEPDDADTYTPSEGDAP